MTQETQNTTEETAIRNAVDSLIQHDGLACRWGYTEHLFARHVNVMVEYLSPKDLDGHKNRLALRA